MKSSRTQCTAILLLTVALTRFGTSQVLHDTDSPDAANRVALLPFELHGITQTEGDRLWDQFAASFGESKRFELMPATVVRNNLEQAGLTRIDSCNTVPCIAQLGKVLNVGKIVHVTADRWDKRYILHIRMIRSSDGALLYDERVDYTGEFEEFRSGVATEQGKKLAAAFLDAKPNWYLIAAVIVAGVGLIYWLFKTFGSYDSSLSQTTPHVGTPQ